MDRIEDAMEIGRANQRAYEMMRNHCLNARVSTRPSELGRMTGVPIGPTEIKCEHAPFFGMSGVDLTWIAVDFYKTNCEGCTHRNPTGRLPTIVTEVESRRKQQQEEEQNRRANEQSEREEWAARRNRRNTAVLGQPYPVRDLAEQIALMDVEPNSADAVRADSVGEASRRVLQTARAAPNLFSTPLVETIIVLAENSDGIAHAVLLALAKAGTIPKEQAASLAARTLERAPIFEAGQTVGTFADALSPSDVAAACRGSIALASDPDRLFGHGARAAEPFALLSLACVSLETVCCAVIEGLHSDDGWYRQAAADAARHLLRDDSTRINDLGHELVRAVRGDDRGYAGKPHADSAAVHALSEAWFSLPDATCAIVEHVALSLTDDGKAVLARIPGIVFRKEKDLSAEAERAAVEFLLRRLDGSWGDEAAREVSDDLQSIARDRPSVLVPNIDALLAALITECNPIAPVSVLLPSPASEVHKMERDIAVMARQARRRRLAEALGNVAHLAPTEVLSRVFTILDATAGDEDLDRTTRVTLIDVLEHAVNINTLTRVLPWLYTFLLSADQSTRAAAIRLWEACARIAPSLPDELTALAPTLLGDPYVIVHSAMVRAICNLGLPVDVARSLLGKVAAIAHTHSNNAEVLEKALQAVLWSAETADDDDRAGVAKWVIERCGALEVYARERLLLQADLREYRQSPEWSKAAMQLLYDLLRSDYTISPRDNRVLAALLASPKATATVPDEMFRAVAEARAPELLADAAEMVELLQSSGRWRGASELAAAIGATVPLTLEYASRREWFAAIVDAAVCELAVSEGQHLPLSSNLAESGRDEPLYIHVVARSRARAALASRADPSTAADAVEQAAKEIDEAPGGDVRVELYSSVLRISAALLRCDAALLAADGENIAVHLASAKRNAKALLERAMPRLGDDDAITMFAKEATEATLDDLDRLLPRAASIPLALPLADRALRSPRRRKDGKNATAANAFNNTEPPLAVCLLALNGHPVIDVQVLREQDVHDLTLDVRLQEWPEWADVGTVQLLSTLPPDALLLPEFTFTRSDAADDEYGIRLTKTGTLVFRKGRPAGAGPLDLRLFVRFSSADARRAETASVGGYERLCIRPFDVTRDVLTNHRQMDQRLLEMYAQLYADRTLDADDVKNFCTFFTACVKAGQGIMFDPAFRAGQSVTETKFHDALEERLENDPELPGQLTRRDRLAHGFDDLMYEGIVAELKVEKATPRTAEECSRYIGQPTQYAVAKGSRLSILIVLEHTKKTSPPGVLEEYMGWLFPAQHGLSDPKYPSRVGVLVINSNWPVPSSWSRRQIATRPSP